VIRTVQRVVLLAPEYLQALEPQQQVLLELALVQVLAQALVQELQQRL
jgi:hypothetical protein